MEDITFHPGSYEVKTDNGLKWQAAGIARFNRGFEMTEKNEYCGDTLFDTKEEADEYFRQAVTRKYRDYPREG